MILDGLMFTTTINKVTDVEMWGETSKSYDEVRLEGEVCKHKLREALHELVDGDSTFIWSDCDPEEPSERRYYAFGNKNLYPANSVDKLVEFMNDIDYDIYMVELEQYM